MIQLLVYFRILNSARLRIRANLIKFVPFAVVLLSGCTVGPDFKVPKTELPETYSQAGYSEFTTDSIELNWWSLFDDEQLNELIEQAIKHNYELKRAQASIREARMLYLESGLNLLPTITSVADYSDIKRSRAALNNRTYVPRGRKMFNIGFDATWEVDFFGRIRRGIEANKDEMQAEQANLHDLTLTLIAEVARNYFQLRGLQYQLEVAKDNIRIQTETLEITQARVESGRGTEFDSARAMAQLETTRGGLPILENSILQAVHRISVLTGQAPGALTPQLSEAAPLPKIPDTIHIGTPTQLLRRRPDVRIAERTLAASTARIGVATADLFPRVTFNGDIAFQASTLSGLGGVGSTSYSAGPGISWPALNLGRVYAQLQAVDAHAEADLNQYKQTVLNALEETENALVNYNRERVRQTYLQRAAEASQTAHRLARLRFNAGITDFLTVLNAELQLLQDQESLAQTKTAVATALVALYKALGGGWEVMKVGTNDGSDPSRITSVPLAAATANTQVR